VRKGIPKAQAEDIIEQFRRIGIAGRVTEAE